MTDDRLFVTSCGFRQRVAEQTHRQTSEGQSRRRRSVRYGEEGEEGEERWGCGLVVEEVSLWWEGRKRARGYRVSCRVEGAGLLWLQPSMIGPELEELTGINRAISDQ